MAGGAMAREERITAQLVAALEPLIPASCTVSVREGSLDFAFEGRWEVSMDLGFDGRAPETLAVNVLNTIQDAIVRSVHRPWPPAGDPGHLAISEAAVRSGQLLAWYGPETGPTVTLPPIDLTTV